MNGIKQPSSLEIEMGAELSFLLVRCAQFDARISPTELRIQLIQPPDNTFKVCDMCKSRLVCIGRPITPSKLLRP